MSVLPEQEVMESWPPLVSGVRMSGVGAAAVWEPLTPSLVNTATGDPSRGNYSNVYTGSGAKNPKHGDPNPPWKQNKGDLGRLWPLGHAYDLIANCTHTGQFHWSGEGE